MIAFKRDTFKKGEFKICLVFYVRVINYMINSNFKRLNYSEPTPRNKNVYLGQRF